MISTTMVDLTELEGHIRDVTKWAKATGEDLFHTPSRHALDYSLEHDENLAVLRLQIISDDDAVNEVVIKSGGGELVIGVNIQAPDTGHWVRRAAGMVKEMPFRGRSHPDLATLQELRDRWVEEASSWMMRILKDFGETSQTTGWGGQASVPHIYSISPILHRVLARFEGWTRESIHGFILWGSDAPWDKHPHTGEIAMALREERTVIGEL